MLNQEGDNSKKKRIAAKDDQTEGLLSRALSRSVTARNNDFTNVP